MLVYQTSRFKMNGVFKMATKFLLEITSDGLFVIFLN